MSTSKRVFNELTMCAGLSIQEEEEALVEISGKDPILDTPILAGEAVASALAAQVGSSFRDMEIENRTTSTCQS